MTFVMALPTPASVTRPWLASSSRARLYSTTSRIFPPVVTLTSSSSAGSDGDGASTLTYLSMSDDAAASGARAPFGEFVHARRTPDARQTRREYFGSVNETTCARLSSTAARRPSSPLSPRSRGRDGRLREPSPEAGRSLGNVPARRGGTCSACTPRVRRGPRETNTSDTRSPPTRRARGWRDCPTARARRGRRRARRRPFGR
mmetsp:Transcript_2357/g.9120  ORF Transcript_2357/g.9120 Transcript_2357/m.9120 type:complete len:203 (+) Transcript_2357:2028-2636(+)